MQKPAINLSFQWIEVLLFSSHSWWEKRQMNIKDRVEHNPFIYILTTTLLASSFAVGIAEYFCRERIEVASQKSALEISTLQSELSSIKRGLGDSKWLDVRTFVHPKNYPGSLPVSTKSKFFASEDFYAVTDIPGWSYNEQTPEQLSEKYHHGKLKPSLRRLVGDQPLHIWTSRDVMSVEEEVEKDYFFVTEGPMIALQRAPYTQVSKVFEHLPELVEEQFGEKVEFTPDDIKDARTYLDRLFRGDAAAVPLAELLRGNLVPFPTERMVTQLVELQKVGNVVYAQFFSTLHDAKVDKKTVPIFYERKEIIMITDQDSITTIVIDIPTGDPSPRGPVYAQVQEWFAGLAVLVK